MKECSLTRGGRVQTPIQQEKENDGNADYFSNKLWDIHQTKLKLEELRGG